MIRKVGRTVARSRVMRAVAVRVARHDLVLVYHRVGEERGPGLVPTVSPERLRAHLGVLRASGRIVSLADLLDRPGDPGPRFSVTFDDDYASHASAALPALGEAGVPATFFLCGRALHGLGAAWWERLEALLAAEGPERVSRMLGAPTADPEALASRLEGDGPAQRRVVEISPEGPAPLATAGIRQLVAAGMDIGFHTLDHPLLTSLDDAALDEAVVHGRGALAAEVGRPLEHFAYPHGKADRRVAAAARRAGYRAAWTGWPAPVRADSDRFLLPRWEPGCLDEKDFAAALAVRLHRTAPAHRGALRG